MPRKKSKLSQETLDDLARSGIDAKRAEKMGIEDVDDDWCHDYVGIPRAGYKIPYFDVHGKEIDSPEFFRVRFTQFMPAQKIAGKMRKGDEIKYANPSGARPYAYFSTSEEWPIALADPSVEITFTEGEKKAECACMHDIKTIGLGGVWNFKSTGRGWTLLPELENAVWDGRSVKICYDSDVMTKREVQNALLTLTEQLVDRGAIVSSIYLMPSASEGKLGLDDFLMKYGIKEYQKIEPQLSAFSRAYEKLNARFCYLTEVGAWYDLEQRVLITNRAHVRDLSAPIAKILENKGSEKNPKMVEVPAFEKWMESPHRRNARNLAYDPACIRSITSDNKVNIYVAPEMIGKRGATAQYHELVKHVFGNSRDWFMKWLAYPVQNPGAKLYQSVFVWSRGRGVGKSFIVTPLMRHIYGDDNFSYINNDNLTSNFNEEIANKQFAVFDECHLPTLFKRQEMISKLNDMITREKITMNAKHQRPVVLRDCTNYYITSNYEDAIPIDDEDRRFYVVEAPNEKFEQGKYRALNNWLRDPDDESKPGAGVPALLHYLQHEVDVSDFDPKASAPRTEAREGVIEISRTCVEEFAARLAKGTLFQEGEYMGASVVNAEELRRLFRQYYPQAGEVLEATICRAVNKYKEEIPKAEPRSSGTARTHYTLWAIANKDLLRKMKPAEWLAMFMENNTQGITRAH